jgi:hypothetical protein
MFKVAGKVGCLCFFFHLDQLGTDHRDCMVEMVHSELATAVYFRCSLTSVSGTPARLWLRGSSLRRWWGSRELLQG